MLEPLPNVIVHEDRALKEVIRLGVPNPRGLISSEGEVPESAHRLCEDMVKPQRGLVETESAFVHGHLPSRTVNTKISVV